MKTVKLQGRNEMPVNWSGLQEWLAFMVGLLFGWAALMAIMSVIVGYSPVFHVWFIMLVFMMIAALCGRSAVWVYRRLAADHNLSEGES